MYEDLEDDYSETVNIFYNFIKIKYDKYMIYPNIKSKRNKNHKD